MLLAVMIGAVAAVIAVFKALDNMYKDDDLIVNRWN